MFLKKATMIEIFMSNRFLTVQYIKSVIFFSVTLFVVKRKRKIPIWTLSLLLILDSSDLARWICRQEWQDKSGRPGLTNSIFPSLDFVRYFFRLSEWEQFQYRGLILIS